MSWGVEDLMVRYGAHEALRGVDLEVEAGGITAVIGGDGAGKTTLLAALAGGGVAPTGGRIRRPRPEGIGLLPATGGSWADLTVVENLRFAAAAYGVSGPELDRRLDELLERTQLSAARHRRADRLSGGMRQKLGFAMAVIHRPDLVVLDEPTTGVDPVSRAELWRLVARVAADGAAVVLATTYLDEAERADRILLLHDGQVLAAGTREEVVASVPGALHRSARRPADAARAWRGDDGWREWRPDGVPPPAGPEIRPSLEDAVVIAILADRQEAPA